MLKKSIVLLVLLGLLAACNVEETVNTAVPLEVAPPQPMKTATEDFVPTVAVAPELGYSGMPSCLTNLRSVQAKVLDVIDGDTIAVNINGVHAKVRYLGIDTPELHATDPTQGQAALDANSLMVKDQTVILLQGDEDRDSYGRLLRFVISNGVFVNLELVKKGNAVSFNRPHDALCASVFDDEMYRAFKGNQGLWQAIRAAYEPEATPEASCPQGCEKHVKSCDIKGNISKDDDYIFHLPGTKDYAGTSISPKSGERWFCTLEEAVANGFRPPRSE